MSRSSIFSFDTLAAPRQIPRGLLLAVVLLAMLEFGVARQDWYWKDIPRTQVGVVDAMEKHVIVRARDPRVVFLGNSRLRDAVTPRVLEEELSLPTGTALNLAMTDGQPVDSMVIYRRNRDKLSQARLLVISVEPHQFIRRNRLTERVQRFTTLDERFELFAGTPDLIPSIVGYYWRTFGIARSLGRWVARPLFPITTDLPFAEDGRVVWRPSDASILTDVEDGVSARVERFYGRRRVDSSGNAALMRLIRMAKSDGLKVVVIVVPMRNSVAELARQNHSEVYAYCMDQVTALGQEGDLLLVYERAADLGLEDDDFYDYGHMTPRAAAVMTKTVAEALEIEFPQILAGSP